MQQPACGTMQDVLVTPTQRPCAGSITTHLGHTLPGALCLNATNLLFSLLILACLCRNLSGTGV